MWGIFLTPEERRNEDMQFIHDWLNANSGRIAYTTYGKYGKELFKMGIFKKWLSIYKNSQKAKLIDPDECAHAEKEFPPHKIISDDPHILALAKVGDIKILCTSDKKLKMDFEQHIKGEVYETKEDEDALLNSPPCP